MRKTDFINTAIKAEIEIVDGTDFMGVRYIGAWAPRGQRFADTDTHYIHLSTTMSGETPAWKSMAGEIFSLVECEPSTCECECFEN
jgi:hypothetical protein|tara:strand:- start:58 stop:315 length:258 start_codon:yes stop_codon:yes gene_type:complete